MSDMGEMISEYFMLAKVVHNHCGYKEDWVTIPLDDARGYYWRIVGGESVGGAVRFHESKEKIEFATTLDYYEDSIYAQHFLPKWVYRGAEFTLVCCDTHIDGNKYLRIFDNAKELPAIAYDDNDFAIYGDKL